MLTAAGCRNRRVRLWDAVRERVDIPALVLADPLHLRYLANFYVDPFRLRRSARRAAGRPRDTVPRQPAA
jgi:hypothetical protein